MVESSKILTVSYGTFSCTLEGFDDSFSTMKAIAEYFRDLAAGDRYFGAEPPTPDAEMLTRIAERETARRVEMRPSETGIVLRAVDATPQAAAAPAAVFVQAPTAQPAQQPQSPVAAEAEVATSSQPVATTPEPEASTAPAEAESEAAPVMPPVQRPPVSRDAIRDRARAAAEDADLADSPMMTQKPILETVAAPLSEPPAHPDADSVAAKLQRIRAVVGGVAPSGTSPYVEDLEDAIMASDDSQDDTTFYAPVAVAPEETPDDKDALSDAVTQTEDTPDSLVADEDESETILTTEPSAATNPLLSDKAMDDAIARAMAVFGGMDETSDNSLADTPTIDIPDTPVMSEAFDEEASRQTTDETDDQIAAVLRNLERAGLRQPTRETLLSQDGVAKPEAVAEASDDATVAEPAKELATFDVADETVAQSDNETAKDTADSAQALEDVKVATAPAAPRGRILRVTRRPRPIEATSEPDDETSSPVVAQIATDPESVETWPQDPALSQDDASDDQEEVDTITSAATLDGAEDLTDFDPKAASSTLSEEDEADLQRELAALADDTDYAEDVEETEVAEVTEPAAKPRRDPLPDTTEAEMSRIMSQADEELADPGASRRRNAIAHLKAAVAATEAARQLGEPKESGAPTENAFREDFDEVVRPRRAARPEIDPERNERARPAPLRLVDSQRVDLTEVPSSAPVQPRRVGTQAPAPTEDAGNFAEFAESMGATSLQDLLEAAAAYTAFVEGSEDFSRPHIMQKVRQTVSEDFSREDGLRSFGTLLRQGRIERVRNGRFAVSHRTRFKPEAMAAGA